MNNLYSQLQGYDPKEMAKIAGKQFGLGEGQMVGVGTLESGFQTNAQAKTSSARGLYQFTKGTWDFQMKTNAAKYGIPEGATPDDPVANTILAGAYMKSNADSFKATFGTDANPTDIYLGHFLGTGGRNKFMKAYLENPNATVQSVIDPDQYAANAKMLKGKTLADLYQSFNNKLSAYVGQSGKAPEGKFGLDITKGQAPEAMPSKEFKPEDVVEEKGFFDDTWATVKAELTLSTFGRNIGERKGRTDTSELSREARDIASQAGDVDVPSLPRYAAVERASQRNLQMMTGKRAVIDNEPLEVITITPKMLEDIKKTGLDDKWLPFLRGATSANDLAAKIDQALELQAADKIRKEAGTGAQLIGGLAGAIGDPTSYIPIGGVAASIGKRVATQASYGAMSGAFTEGSLENFTGGAIEGDYGSAIVGGAAFGGGLAFAGGMFGKFMGNRMSAREQAINAGAEVDPSLHPTVRADDARGFVDSPDEPGAVINSEGQILSAMNPMNPKTQALADDAIKAARSITPGHRNLQDISISVLSNEDVTVRNIGQNLMRSSTGIEGGGSGLQRMVAEDIVRQLGMRDNAMYFDLKKQLNDAMETGVFGLNADSRMTAQRGIVEAIESGDLSKLTPEQMKVAETVRQNFINKFDDASNPAKFGNGDAPPVFESGRNASKYFPQIFEEGKRNAAIVRFGGNQGLQDAIAFNWKNQYKADHNGVKAHFAEIFKEDIAAGKNLDELVDDYINSKSYGIAHAGDFTHSSSLAEADIRPFSSVTSNNDFTKERNIFDSAFKTIADDGVEFALNDLRHFDIMNTVGMYNRRMNGDIAIHGSTGSSTASLIQKINEVGDNLGKKDLQEVVKIITGQARRDPTGTWGSAIKSLQDLSFAARGAMMWTNQIAEGAGFAANRTLSFIRNIDRKIDGLMNPRSKFSKKDIKEFQRTMFGLEFNDVMAPSFSQYKESLQATGAGNVAANIAASGRVVTSTLARNSPFTHMLSKSTQFLIDKARGATLGDVADDALTGRVMFTDAQLKSADITPEQYQGIKDMMKQHLKEDKNGNLKINSKAVLNDVRSNDLWRLAEAVANETVFRTGKIGQAYTRAPGAGMGMVLQFKAFAIKGLNGRFMKVLNEAGQGRAVDHAFHTMLGIGFAGAIYAARSHANAFGMPDSKKDKYLDKALSPSALTYNALSRSSIIGIPLGSAGMIGPDAAKMGRTTLEADRFNEEKADLSVKTTNRQQVQDAMGKFVTDAIPAAGMLAAGGASAMSAADWATADEGHESYEHKKAFIGNIRGLLPNDPFTQKLISMWAEEVDVYDR